MLDAKGSDSSDAATSNSFDIDVLIGNALRGEILSESRLLELCHRTRILLNSLPNCLGLVGPVTVVGDTHGQFRDLLSLFEIAGSPPDVNYLFLGNYINRGTQSIEVITLLFLFFLKYPHRVSLLRGNQDSREMSEVYGFSHEVETVFPSDEHGRNLVLDSMFSALACLPLCAVVNDSLFCVHSGLSPHFEGLADIAALDRTNSNPYEGPVCDMVWSEPASRAGWGVVPEGSGYFFGKDVTESFLNSWRKDPGTEGKVVEGLRLFVRSHVVVMDGYCMMHDGKLLSIFSSPNYCSRVGNRAAVLQVGEMGSDLIRVISYSSEGKEVRFEELSLTEIQKDEAD